MQVQNSIRWSYFLTLLIILRAVVGQNEPQKKSVTFCHLVVDLPSAFVMAFAFDYYTRVAPNALATEYEWKWLFLANFNTTAEAVRLWDAERPRCDALLGPAFSSYSEAVSPLVTIPWISDISSASYLGDKAQHPFFSRIIPSDVDAGRLMAQTLKYFGWDAVGILHVDEVYGRSVADALSSNFQSDTWGKRGEIVNRAIVSRNSTEEDISMALDSIFAEGRTRVLAFAGNIYPAIKSYIASDGLILANILDLLIFVIKKKKLENEIVLVLSETWCGENTNTETWLKLPGSLCVSFSRGDTEVSSNFYAAYRKRNATPVIRDVIAAGVQPDDKIEEKAKTAYAGSFTDYAHDAVKFMVTAWPHIKREAMLTGQPKLSIALLRKHTIKGINGDNVSLEENGNRRNGFRLLRVLNSQQNSSLFSVFSVPVGTLDESGTTFIPDWKTETLFLAGAYRTFTDRIPTRLIPLPNENSDQNKFLIVATSILGVALFAVAITVIGCKCFRSYCDGSRFAPSDEKCMFTIVFTDIQSSTNLWGRLKQRMGDAVEAHHRIIRHQIRKHRGYEIKTIGDSFMVAFTESSDALHFSAEVQTKLFSWPGNENLDEEINALYAESCQQSSLWNGLRVRIGMNTGLGRIIKDPTTRRYDYYGDIVNIAARIESAAHGGQILATDTTLRQAENINSLKVTLLGSYRLRGVEEKIPLYQISPEMFAERTFPPLRVEQECE